MRWVILLAFSSAAAWAEERPGIVVLDLDRQGTTELEAGAATVAVAQSLRELDAFNVVSADDTRKLLSLERQRELLGQGGEESRGIMQSIGVRYVVAGSAVRSDGTLGAELRLLDTDKGAVLSQRSVPRQPSLDKLNQGLTVAAQQLVSGLLAQETGQLRVRVREEGAEILVDDVIRGTSPLPAALELPRGRHKLLVKKDGFVAWAGTATVRKGELTAEQVSLIPSADYARAYEAKHRKLRIGAWAGAAVAVAGLGSALVLDRYVAESKYQDEFIPRRDALLLHARGQAGPGSGEIQAQCLSDVDGCRQQAESIKSEISTLQTASWLLVGVGLAGAGAAAYCLVQGDDPNRYVDVVGALAPGSASVGLVGRF